MHLTTITLRLLVLLLLLVAVWLRSRTVRLAAVLRGLILIAILISVGLSSVHPIRLHSISVALLHGVRALVRLVRHSEDGSNFGVSQWVPQSVILAEVLPLQRRVQVLELNANATLAQQVLLGQVVVNLVLGLVQVVLVVVLVVVVRIIVVPVVVVVMVILAVSSFFMVIIITSGVYRDSDQK